MRLEGNRSARLVVIAAEGRYTENIYFEAVRSNAEAMLENADLAVVRAESLDTCPSDRWPQQIGTRVYLLMNSIKRR